MSERRVAPPARTSTPQKRTRTSKTRHTIRYHMRNGISPRTQSVCTLCAADGSRRGRIMAHMSCDGAALAAVCRRQAARCQMRERSPSAPLAALGALLRLCASFAPTRSGFPLSDLTCARTQRSRR